MADFLAALLARFRAAPGGPRSYALPDVPAEPAPAASQPSDPLTYNVFFRELTGYLERAGLFPQVTLILGESTSLYVFGNLFGLPVNRFVAQAAWGSLGHETGCALGVALASGTRPYVVAGDGGVRVVCQGRSRLGRQKANAGGFVMRNDAYAIEEGFVGLGALQAGGAV